MANRQGLELQRTLAFFPCFEYCSGPRFHPRLGPMKRTLAEEKIQGSLEDGHYIVFDIETTGGNPERNCITEIFAVKYHRRKMQQSFYSLVNPQMRIPPIVSRMTGITNKSVARAPKIHDVMPAFLEFIGEDVLVSHNTIGDLRFLHYFARHCCQKELENFFLCTHLLTEKLLPDSPDKSLSGLCKYLGLPVEADHRADADGFATVELFAKLLDRLKEEGVGQIRDAIRLQGDTASGLRVGWNVSGEALARASVVEDWRRGRPVPDGYVEGIEALEELGQDARDVAGLAVFRTQDPLEELRLVVEDMHRHAPGLDGPLELAEQFDDYCVYNSTISMPVYQRGEPPFRTTGGDLVFENGRPVRQGTERANVVLTVPRGEAPVDGWPVAVFVRTGGGGDRPLVDRGVRPGPDEEPEVPGSGPARDLAWAGFAAISVDGPHGGLRNVTGGDEQFLMFNVLNPAAMRDNVRQSAAELTLLPDLLDELEVDAGGCGGSKAGFDGEHIAIIGHSMGATIAPLTLATQPRYGAAVLSGFGGSWVMNIVHKRSPLDVRPLAEGILGYPQDTLTEHDPALGLLQLAGESADPPVASHVLSARDEPVHVYMAQGIVDSYILPPIANAGALSLGLDLAGDALDAEHAELASYVPLDERLPLVGGRRLELPVSGSDGGRTAVVVQHAEDAVEDGHEVYFQTEGPKHQARCFLQTWVRDGVPTVPVAGRETDPCR